MSVVYKFRSSELMIMSLPTLFQDFQKTRFIHFWTCSNYKAICLYFNLSLVFNDLVLLNGTVDDNY